METAIAENKERELLTGKDLIVFSMRFTQEDRSKSWTNTLINFLVLLLAFVAGFFATTLTEKIISGTILGLSIIRFFMLYHDYLHGAILQKSNLAKAIFAFFGVFVLAPNNIWKRTHDHHHNHNAKLSNSGIGSYPLLSKNDFEKLPNGQKILYKLARNPLTIIFGHITLFILDFNVKSIIKNPKVHWDSLVALLVYSGISYALYDLGGWTSWFLCYFLPFFCLHGFGAYLFFVQHNFPGAEFEEGQDWDYTQAAIKSTSFLKMNPIMNWITANIGYHHVHHVNHRIPFYRLKEAMNGMPELHHPITTTMSPKDVWACFRLKVWDPDKRELTGY